MARKPTWSSIGTDNPIVNALGAVFIRLVAVLTYVS